MADTYPIQHHGSLGELNYGIGNSAQTVTVGGRTVIAQSLSIQEEGELKEYKDNMGVPCAIVIPEQHQTVNISGLMINSDGANPPKKGDEVTLPTGIDGLDTTQTFRLDTFSTDFSNEDVTKVSMTVRGYKF